MSGTDTVVSALLSLLAIPLSALYVLWLLAQGRSVREVQENYETREMMRIE